MEVEFGDSNRVYKNVKAHSIDNGLLTIEYHTQAVYIPLDGVVSITAKPHKIIDPTGIHCFHHREGEFYIPEIENS